MYLLSNTPGNIAFAKWPGRCASKNWYFIEHNVASFFDCSKQIILPRYGIFL